MRVPSPIVLIIAATLLLVSCRPRTPGGAVTPEEERTAVFDPLESPADREIVPEVYPSGSSGAKSADSSSQKSGARSAVAPSDQPSEIYRVQLFMSRLYNEAHRERALADEMFSLPVYLDYEVPYYKLRVGDFTTREEAEGMIPAIQGLGYSEAWVARVVQKIKEVPADTILEAPLLNPGSSPDSTKPAGKGESR